MIAFVGNDGFINVIRKDYTLPAHTYAFDPKIDRTAYNLETVYEASNNAILVMHDGTKKTKGDFYAYGDVYINGDDLLYVPNVSATGYKAHITGSYTGATSFDSLMPTKLLVDPISKVLGRPAKAWCGCKGGYLVQFDADFLFGLDAEYYCLQNGRLVALFGAKASEFPFCPLPTADGATFKNGALKEIEWIKKFISETEYSLGSVQKNLLYNLPEMPDNEGFILDGMDVYARAAYYKLSAGLPVSGLENYKAFRLTKKANSDAFAKILFALETYTDECTAALYTDVDAPRLIEQALINQKFDNANLYDVDDYVNQSINAAYDAKHEAELAYWKQKAEELKDYAEQIVVLAQETAGTQLAASLKRAQTNFAGSVITIPESVFKIKIPEVPEQGGRSDIDYARLLYTRYGAGFDSTKLKISELPDAMIAKMQSQIDSLIATALVPVKESCGAFESTLRSCNIESQASIENSYYVFWKKKSQTFSYFAGKSYDTLGDRVQFSNAALLDLGDGKLQLKIEAVVAPFSLIHHRGDNGVVGTAVQQACQIMRDAGWNVEYNGQTENPWVSQQSHKLRWCNWKYFCGVKWWRWSNYDGDYEVAAGHMLTLTKDIVLPSVETTLDLGTADMSEFNVMETAASTAGWLAFANTLAARFDEIKTAILTRKPFAVVDGIRMSMQQAKVLYTVAVSDSGMQEAIDKLAELGEVGEKALEVLKVIREVYSNTGSAASIDWIDSEALSSAQEFECHDALPVTIWLRGGKAQ